MGNLWKPWETRAREDFGRWEYTVDYLLGAKPCKITVKKPDTFHRTPVKKPDT
jgi:hypothetical protein